MRIKCKIRFDRGTRTFVSKKGKDIIITSYLVEVEDGSVYDARLFGEKSVGAKVGDTVQIQMTQFGRSSRTHEVEISGEIVKA